MCSVLPPAQLRALMKTISLRREKSAVTDFQLPTKTEINVLVHLSPKEQDAYSAIHEAVLDYQAFVSASAGNHVNGMLQHTNSMLSLITRMRQACLDLRLVPVEALVKILATANKSPTTVMEALSSAEKAALIKKLNDLFAAAGTLAASANVTDDIEVIDCAICLEPLMEDAAIIFRICKNTPFLHVGPAAAL